MEKDYIIAWKSQTNARMGRGKALLSKDEAEKLANDLNQQHPGFAHVAVHKDEQNIAAAFPPPPEPQITNLVELANAPAAPAAPHTEPAEEHSDKSSDDSFWDELTGT
jgi:hypothetical protein